MVVGISVFELHLPEARSLKEKRRVVRSLVERIAGRYRVSIYESDHHDLHQRAEIALALIGPDDGAVSAVLERVRDLVDSEDRCVLTHWDPQYLEAMG